MPGKVVELAELSPPERERFLEFLVASQVDFTYDESGDRYVANVRVVRTKQASSAQPGPMPRSSKPVQGSPAASKPTASRRAKSAPRTGHRSEAAKKHPVVAAKRGPAGAVSGPPLRPAPLDVAALGTKEAALRERYSEICDHLPGLAQPPKLMPYSELCRFTEEAYSRAREMQQIGSALEALSIPRAVLALATERYGLWQMVAQTCWSVVSSVNALRVHYSGVDLFGRFLDGSYDFEDLAFCLQVRSVAEQLIRVEVNRSTRNLLQVDVDARQAIHVIRETVRRRDLQAAIFQRLDSDMAASGSNTVALETLWVAATEEFVASRGHFKVPDDPSLAEAWGALDPDLQSRAAQVTERVAAAFRARGETAPQVADTRGWAVRTVARSQSPPPREARMEYSVSTESLQQAWEVVHEEPQEEIDLEKCVQECLALATRNLIEEVVGIPDLKESLAAEFSGVTDAMLEAVVNDDFDSWLTQLNVAGAGSPAQQGYFSSLRTEFQEVLSTGISKRVVERICERVVLAPELVEAVRSARDQAVACRSEAGSVASGNSRYSTF